MTLQQLTYLVTVAECGNISGRRRAAVSLAAEFERRDSQFREGDGRYRLCALKQGRNRHAGGRGTAFVCAHAARAGRHHAGALRRGQKARAQVLRVMSALFVRGERIRRGCQGFLDANVGGKPQELAGKVFVCACVGGGGKDFGILLSNIPRYKRRQKFE